MSTPACKICTVAEAAVLTAWKVNAGCEADVRVPYCAWCWARRSQRIDTSGRAYICGCLLLEVIDLAGTDPGREYAETLRGL